MPNCFGLITNSHTKDIWFIYIASTNNIFLAAAALEGKGNSAH